MAKKDAAPVPEGERVRVTLNPDRVTVKEQVKFTGAADGGGDLVIGTGTVVELSPAEWGRIGELTDERGRRYVMPV